MDADHIYPLILQDAMLDGAYQELTIDSAQKAVAEALHMLHTAPHPQVEGVVQMDLSPEAYLVVGVFQTMADQVPLQEADATDDIRGSHIT